MKGADHILFVSSNICPFHFDHQVAYHTAHLLAFRKEALPTTASVCKWAAILSHNEKKAALNQIVKRTRYLTMSFYKTQEANQMDMNLADV